MRQLLEDYRRRVSTLNEELRITINEADDVTKITRLTIKLGCYRTFISELERLVPKRNNIAPEETEHIIIDEKYEKEREDFKNKLLNDEV
jgi:hypothetical protein